MKADNHSFLMMKSGTVRIMKVLFLMRLLSCRVVSFIVPGTGLVSRDKAVQVVIFEHTSLGTGGLVLNCPTPIRLRDLQIPRFEVFKNHTLMHGGHGTEESSGSNVPIGDMAPWFWLHCNDVISNSFRLEGAAGPLFMGGNLDEAIELIQKDQLDPFTFKFFYKYRQWEGGELEKEIENAQWTVSLQDPAAAVRPYSLPVFE